MGKRVYTQAQAYGIFQMADRLTAAAEKALREEGWGVKSEWDSDWWMRIEKFIPDPIATADETGNTPHLEEREKALWIYLHVTRGMDGKPGEVSFTCKHQATEADIPVILRLLGAAMAPLVGPYMVANAECW